MPDASGLDGASDAGRIDGAVDASDGRDGARPDAMMMRDGAGEPDRCVPPSCPPPPDGCRYEGATECTCGTLVCARCTPESCPEGEYCHDPEIGACGSSDRVRCERRPDACALFYDPVCGCDGVTYSNACNAASAGVNVAYDGECTEEPPMPEDECLADGDCATGNCQLCRTTMGLRRVCLPPGAVC